MVGGLYLYYKNHPADDNKAPISVKQLKPTIEFISDFLSLLINAIQIDRERIEKMQQILRHELKQAIDSISQGAKDILDIIDKPIPPAMPARNIHFYLKSRIDLKYRDMKAFRKTLIDMIKILNVEDFDNFIKSGLEPIMYMFAKKHGDIIDSNKEAVNIRKMFIEIWKSQINSQDLKFPFKEWKITPIIKVNKAVLQGILQNLIGNAARYSIYGSDIEAYIEYTEYNIKIHVVNIAPSFKNNKEEDSIFTQGFRGSNVEAETNFAYCGKYVFHYFRGSNVEAETGGEGLGLSIARRLCEHLGGSLDLEIEKPEKNKRSRFDFIVTLPNTLLIK